MTGASRKTGKASALDALATHLGISPPTSAGGTVPKDWLVRAVRAGLGEAAPHVGEHLTKREILRSAIEAAGGAWQEEYITPKGSTITGEALTELTRLLRTRAGDTKRGQSPASSRVNIRPKVTVLSVLAHLEYKPWFALAEFVDNSIQSFEATRGSLQAMDTSSDRLRVEIEVDRGQKLMRISDNAGGIALEDFPRAFRPAEAPPDRSGLSEFGMGMKAASCWFSPVWSVRTTAIGESVERTVTFDIDRIVTDELEELIVDEREVAPESHYTVIELRNVRSLPTGRTSGKIRDHLSDIYREFIREGQLDLRFRGDSLEYVEPEVLVAPRYNGNNEPSGEALEWRKAIEFDLGLGQRIRGFAALRETGSTSHAGFSLFRRRRVIQGSADDKYRPPEIFGAANSFVSQRLFGELHLEGFEVSHTKDGFRWDDSEDAFLDLLREKLDADDLPLLRQARNYRAPAKKASDHRVLRKAVDATAGALGRHGGQDIDSISADGPDDRTPPAVIPDSTLLAEREFRIERHGITWIVQIELSGDSSETNWLVVGESREDSGDEQIRSVRLRVCLESKFMRRLVRLDDSEALEPVIRLAAGIGLSEHLARASGLRRAGEVRRNLNHLLNGSLASKD